MGAKPRILMLVVSAMFALTLTPGVALAEENNLVVGSTNLATQAAAHTQDEAVAWAHNMANTHEYCGECVALIQKYYTYLGVSVPNTNANTYANADHIPSGWTVDNTPSLGAVYVEANYSPGHVSIVVGIDSSGTLTTVDSNVTGTSIDQYRAQYFPWTTGRTRAEYAGVAGKYFVHPQWANSDGNGPSYSDFRVAEIEDAKFTVMAKVSDSSGIQSVRYAVWTEDNGQDELVWYDGHCTDGNGVYWAHVPYSEHKNEKGKYIIHMYATDNANNETSAGISYRFDTSGPTVEDFHAGELNDNRFTAMAKIASPNGLGSVRYAVWSEYNGQDDIKWYNGNCTDGNGYYWVRIPFSDHNGERGNYIIHLYAYDTGGKLTNLGIEYVASPAVPSATVAEGKYAIRTKLDASKGVDVYGLSQDNLANVMLNGWNGGDNQVFSVKAAGDGSYYVIASHSNKAVEVTNGSAASGANIAQYAQNQTSAQRWYFIKNSDGTYTLRNKASGLVMDVDHLQTADGTNVQQCTYNGGDNQKFYLVPTDVSKWSVSLPSAARIYTGKAWEPLPTVTAGGVPMVKGRDFTVSYKNNVNAGTATVTVTGKGGFSGAKSVQFTISAANDNSGGSAATKSMHRLYNPNSGEHFYTSNEAEYQNVKGAGWNDEGFGWTAPVMSNTPVYRLYNANGGEHHYTTSKDERDSLVRAGWTDEGIGWYSDDAKTVPLYREYNPNAFANNHNYTTSASEHRWLLSLGWRDEGYAWYGM